MSLVGPSSGRRLPTPADLLHSPSTSRSTSQSISSREQPQSHQHERGRSTVISQAQPGTHTQQRTAEEDEFADDPMCDDQYPPTGDEAEDEHDSYQDDVNEPQYVLHSEYMRVCAERDRYLEALRNITGYTTGVLGLPDPTQPKKFKLRKRRRLVPLPRDTIEAEEQWTLHCIKGPGLLPGSEAEVAVYRVDRGDHLDPRQRYLFRNTVALQLLQLAPNQQDGALKKVQNLINNRASMKCYVIKDVAKMTLMLRELAECGESRRPSSFKNANVNMMQFEAMVQLTAGVYCSHVLPAPAEDSASSGGAAREPSRHKAHTAAVEAAMEAALSWLVDPDAPQVPREEWDCMGPAGGGSAAEEEEEEGMEQQHVRKQPRVRLAPPRQRQRQRQEPPQQPQQQLLPPQEQQEQEQQQEEQQQKQQPQQGARAARAGAVAHSSRHQEEPGDS